MISGVLLQLEELLLNKVIKVISSQILNYGFKEKKDCLRSEN